MTRSDINKKYLSHLLNTCLFQKDIKFQIIISDQSNDNKIKFLCKNKKYKSLDISYHKFDGKRHPSSNLNNALKQAKDKNVKIMFMDDFFLHEYSLLSSVEPLINGYKWTACGTVHTYDSGKSIVRYLCPSYHKKIHLGINTMSSPSVIAFKNTGQIYFDENITYFMDVDWYKRAEIEYGEPYINKSMCIVNRIHDDSLSNSKFSNFIESSKKELPYIIKKYQENITLENALTCIHYSYFPHQYSHNPLLCYED